MMRSSARRTRTPSEPSAYRPARRKLERCGGHPTGSPTTIACIELSAYQQLSRRTAEYPRQAWLTYPSLGLVGEAGEVAEHAKKAIRDDGGIVTDERRQAMAQELGDVLWYVAQVASELRLELEEIAQANLEKLLSRQRRGVLSGSGDER